MNGQWQIVLHQSALQMLLSSRPRDREHLLRTMQNLLQDPYQKGSFVERGPDGRNYEIKVSGPFHVAFWLDAWDKEIRIVRIEKLTNR